MILLALILILFNTFACTTNSSIGADKNNAKHLIEDFREVNYNNSNITDIVLTNKNGVVKEYDQIFEYSHSFVFLFSKNSCPPCVSDYLQLLNSLGCDFSDQIIVISNHENIRDLRILKSKFACLNFYSQYRSKFPLFVDDYILSKEEPAMMLLSSDGIISNFRRGSAIDSLDNPYFISAIEKLYNNNL